ncbi:hypothetical protein ILUMI_27475 [Ignelater luminosus]|uniref:MRH domain-containing protein n=1 Tax=Ignelater luminosus TaxID=2038154 RepID=A0A8K0C516_IGNLU|nr:hypothetical protein ILUMI_27475 [Ignelater luminosus]
MILKSVNGQPCGSSNENYTIIIQFECHPHSKVTPRYLYKDECELRVEMMHPTCTPTCSTRMNGNLLNFQDLQELGTLAVREPSNKQFKLSFCKAANGCGDGISACDLTNGANTSIGQVAFQRFVINTETNDLIVKSHIGASKRVRLDVEIKLSCNWNAQGINNLRYLVPSIQGKHFKFSGESSQACIKLPQNCIITDAKDSYLMYNLTTLHRRNGNWKVGNVSNGEEIYLNVCGPLHAPSAATTCSDQYSQVCYLDRRRNVINLGSIPLDFHTVDDVIKGTFIAGSVCVTNPNTTYRSEIEFSCSQYEKGPTLQDINGCTYNIKWETPAACSKLFTTGDNCVLYDITGIINLNEIHKPLDRKYILSRTSYLRYNLCGLLNQPCNHNSDASICFVKNNREYVLGFSNKQLIRDNTLLSLKLVGDNCAYQTKSVTQVYFHCNHSAPADGNVVVNMIEENCIVDIIIHTPLACSPPVFSKCEVNIGNKFYNLTSLSQNYNNYLVRGTNTNAVYILNVCQSVFNTRDSLCPSDSGACMKNLTEINIKYKYQSVGRTNINNTPFIENGELVVRYDTGAYCSKGIHHSTTIHFQCHTHEEGPRFLKQVECSHEFFWRTPAACGEPKRILKTRSKDASCIYTYPDTKKQIDLANVNKILEVKIANGESYKFSLCEKNYTHCSLNGTKCNTIDTRIELKLNSNGSSIPYLEYHLQDSEFNKALIYLVCVPLSESHNFTYAGHKNQIIEVNLLTYLSCIGNETESSNEQTQVYNSTTSNNTKIKHEGAFRDLSTENLNNNSSNNLNGLAINQDQNVIKTKNNTFSSSNKELLINKKLSRENNCFIKNDENEAIFFLKNIKSFHASSSSENNYSFMINQPSPDCNGYICKNDYVFIPRTDIFMKPAVTKVTHSTLINSIANRYDMGQLNGL